MYLRTIVFDTMPKVKTILVRDSVQYRQVYVRLFIVRSLLVWKLIAAYGVTDFMDVAVALGN